MQKQEGIRGPCTHVCRKRTRRVAGDPTGARRRSQPKKTAPADIKPAPAQALRRHDRAYFLTSEWTESLGFAEGLRSRNHEAVAILGGCCGRRMRTLLLNSPGGGPSRAQHVKKRATTGHLQEPWGSDYGGEEFTSSRHCRTGGASETP
ncbi:unnamed protein product [Rangifer tarandus platyrhynchus]|uniref:Uncharacterized protein n=2 Tax=Rangifer tarandus platyrhynchus TaxID=3082113 RepID=A0ABN8XWT8_RANTA|nr:unnamed protein product [Rangifer tarandus platyrhynchus]CAI9713520.1 unnamed protein product [Rangifer tarandus platyrhynchus]